MSLISLLRLGENICVLWFTFEYLIRLVTSPNTTKFLLDYLNIVDILCILPFYFGLFLNQYPFFMRIRYLMQMLRALRLLKLGRYSDGIKSFSYALKTSSTTLAYLLVLLAFNVLVFSSILYFAEQEDPGTKFTSILASCWLVSKFQKMLSIVKYFKYALKWLYHMTVIISFSFVRNKKITAI